MPVSIPGAEHLRRATLIHTCDPRTWHHCKALISSLLYVFKPPPCCFVDDPSAHRAPLGQQSAQARAARSRGACRWKQVSNKATGWQPFAHEQRLLGAEALKLHTRNPRKAMASRSMQQQKSSLLSGSITMRMLCTCPDDACFPGIFSLRCSTRRCRRRGSEQPACGSTGAWKVVILCAQ